MAKEAYEKGEKRGPKQGGGDDCPSMKTIQANEREVSGQ